VQVLGRINRPAPCKGLSSSSSSSSNDAEQASAPAAAAAAAAGFRVVVVDFVNSVGAIREAFSQFYGATSFCTGGRTAGGSAVV
jgi:hypothetical protein